MDWKAFWKMLLAVVVLVGIPFVASQLPEPVQKAILWTGGAFAIMFVCHLLYDIFKAHHINREREERADKEMERQKRDTETAKEEYRREMERVGLKQVGHAGNKYEFVDESGERFVPKSQMQLEDIICYVDKLIKNHKDQVSAFKGLNPTYSFRFADEDDGKRYLFSDISSNLEKLFYVCQPIDKIIEDLDEVLSILNKGDFDKDQLCKDFHSLRDWCEPNTSFLTIDNTNWRVGYEKEDNYET